jgi:hypothetical protein
MWTHKGRRPYIALAPHGVLPAWAWGECPAGVICTAMDGPCCLPWQGLFSCDLLAISAAAKRIQPTVITDGHFPWIKNCMPHPPSPRVKTHDYIIQGLSSSFYFGFVMHITFDFPSTSRIMWVRRVSPPECTAFLSHETSTVADILLCPSLTGNRKNLPR